MKVYFRRGFSLIELLTVVCIIIILMAVALPAFNSITAGSNLNRAGQLVSDQISLARQEATSKNRDVQVVFYNLTDGPTKGWRGIKLMRVDQTPTGATANSASRFFQIPEGVIISSNATYSPLLKAGSTGTTNLPNIGSVQYASFRFRANGSLESGVSSANNFLTLQNVNDKSEPPVNYYTIQVDALTGKVSVYRP